MADSLILYILLSLGLALALGLSVTLKRDLNSLERRWAKREQATAAAWEQKVAALDEQVRELSEASRAIAATVPPKSGIHLSKRAQALQLIRRGEAPARIAAALSLPAAEVDLLITVQQMGANL